MDFIPAGPKGPHRPQPPTAPTTDQGPVKKVPVGQKQIPPGKPMERKSLDEWKINPFYATPILTKPSTPAKDEYQRSDAKEQVLAMLSTMEPDVNGELIHRVSAERKAEMAERIARVQKTLGKEPVQKAFESGALLLDLDDKPPAVDVTLNYVMALALKVRRAQDEIRAGISADRDNVEAWKKGLKLFSRVQDAWHELYPVVMDICTHEPLAFEAPIVPLERSQSTDSDDSGVGDLMGFDDPWDQPQILPSPQPVSLPPAAEARISELERKLDDTLDHLQHERSMSERLQESQKKIEALAIANQQVTYQYGVLQKEIEVLRKQPSGANPGDLRKAELKINQLSQKNSELNRQLDWEQDILKQRDSQIAQLESSLLQQDVKLREISSSKEIERKQFVHEKQVLETRVNELEQNLSQQTSQLSSLFTEVTELKETNQKLIRKLNRKDEEISSQQVLLDSVTQELTTTKESIQAESKGFSELQRQLSLKASEYESLQNDYQALVDSKQQLERARDQDRSQHKLKVEELTDKLSLVEKDKEQLSLSLDESRGRVQDLDEKVKELEKARGILIQELPS